MYDSFFLSYLIVILAAVLGGQDFGGGSFFASAASEHKDSNFHKISYLCNDWLGSADLTCLVQVYLYRTVSQ